MVNERPSGNSYPQGDIDYHEDIHDYSKNYMNCPDDAKFFAELLREEWSLDGPAEDDKVPPIYYDVRQTSTRDSTIGSLYVFESSFSFPNKVGIGYEARKQVKAMCIDIQVPKIRERAFVWTREVIRILNKNRRKSLRSLNGWDYLEIKSANQKATYLSYFQFLVEFNLVRNVAELEYDGFGKD